jgi:predicted DCC family thiol-disulfide oxidoreductase YuxK
MNQQAQVNPNKDTLYFDGTCPLCSKEIALLKKLSKNTVVFADIQNLSFDNPATPSQESLLRRLHLKRASGEWLIGLDANVAVWSHTSYGFLFKILRWPIIRNIADKVYANWADKRYEKRFACSKCD